MLHASLGKSKRARPQRRTCKAAALRMWRAGRGHRGDGDVMEAITSAVQTGDTCAHYCPGLVCGCTRSQRAHVRLPCSDGAQRVGGIHARMHIALPDCWVTASTDDHPSHVPWPPTTQLRGLTAAVRRPRGRTMTLIAFDLHDGGGDERACSEPLAR
jgi:hypothetical protein